MDDEGLSQHDAMPRPDNSEHPRQVEVSELEAAANATQAARQQKGRVFENFMKTILEFNRKHGTPIAEQPQIESKSVNLYNLYGYVLKAGGSEAVHSNQQWNSISKLLGFHGHGQAIADIHQRCLRQYEKEWLAKRKANAPQQGNQNSIATTKHTSPADVKPIADHSSPKIEHKRKSDSTSSLDQLSKTAYRPVKRKLDTYLELRKENIAEVSAEISELKPYPTFHELGKLDIQAISKSIQSKLPAEMGNSLDILAIIANDRRWGLPLVHCADLLDTLLDCLSEDRAMSKDQTALNFRSYQGLIVEAKHATRKLVKQSPWLGSDRFQAYGWIERAMSVLTILRNLAFTEINQEFIARSPHVANILAETVAEFYSFNVLGEIGALLLLNFAKDMVTLLSLISANLVIHDTRTASILCEFLLTFTTSDCHEVSQSITLHNEITDPYLTPAVDTIAKLVSRDSPNRRLFRDFLLTPNSLGDNRRIAAMMAMAMTVIAVPVFTEPLSARSLSTRISQLQHALIIAETIVDFCPDVSTLPTEWMDVGNSGIPARQLRGLLKDLSRIPPEMGFTIDVGILAKRAVVTLEKMLAKSWSSSHTGRDNKSAELAILQLESDFGSDRLF